MPTLVDFTRNLKISRFTIDVLIQRLAHLRTRRHQAAEEVEHFAGKTLEDIIACDQLHNELRERFIKGAIDLGAITFLTSGFDELHRKIMNSVDRLNTFEYGKQHSI